MSQPYDYLLCGQQRKSCLPDVYSSIGISVKRCATAFTSPPAIRQCQIGIDGSADVAGFAAGQPAVNFYNDTAVLEGNPLQDLNEFAIRKIRYFPTPQAFHSIQIKILDTNDGVCGDQFVGDLKEPVPSAVTDPLVGTLQIL